MRRELKIYIYIYIYIWASSYHSMFCVPSPPDLKPDSLNSPVNANTITWFTHAELPGFGSGGLS